MMNKFAKALIVVAGLALGAKAQLVGLGWDNNWQEIQARLGLGRNFIDVGAGMILEGSANLRHGRHGSLCCYFARPVT